MRGWRFAIAVALTSLALVAALGVAGALFVRNAVASSPLGMMTRVGGPGGFPGQQIQLPPELQGLKDVPAGERFSHFVGVQVDLKDRNNQPLRINVVPGTVTATDAGNLTIAANDGSSKSFGIDQNTVVRGKPAQGNSPSSQSALANGDRVVVVTLNQDTAARAVINGGADGFAGPGPGGPWGRGHWGGPHW